MPIAEMRVDLKGKVRNISSKSIARNPYLPLYEAIINSIHSIEESKKKDGKITVRVIRQQDIRVSDRRNPPIMSFEIVDNGIGFNKQNWESFRTSDSTYKLEIGGKGIGRFMWLKAFRNVEIKSVFFENGLRMKRVIEFDLNNAIVEKSCERTEENVLTSVKLIDFKDEFRSKDKAYKTREKIAQRILEHFLSFFVVGKNPEIIVEDTLEKGKKISLGDLFRDIKKEMDREEVKIKGKEFFLHHLKLRDTHNQMNQIVFCGHSRKVKEERLDFLGESTLRDDPENGNAVFYYACYVSSSYLDDHIADTRDSFTIPTTIQELENYLGDSPICLDVIKDEVDKHIKVKLASYYHKIEEDKRLAIMRFMEKNPHARAILTRRMNEVLQKFKVNDDDDKINEIFYNLKGETEYHRLKQADEVISKHGKQESIKQDVDKIVATIEDSIKDQLIHYMVFRRCVIDLLKKSINASKNGNIPLEKEIHELIFPMGKTSDQVENDQLNLWIIDEKLAFHMYAASDPKLSQKIEGSESDKRPDVLVCSDERDGVIHNVCIIELKRAYRSDHDPIKQLTEYLEEIQNKKKFKGQPIRVNPHTMYYCYAFCDIDEKFQSIVNLYSLTELPQQMGYFTYNKNLNALIEIRTFDRILEDVLRRHKAFFTKLGI